MPDLHGSIWTFLHNNDGTFHQVNVLDILVPELAVNYAMDCACMDFRACT